MPGDSRVLAGGEHLRIISLRASSGAVIAAESRNEGTLSVATREWQMRPLAPDGMSQARVKLPCNVNLSGLITV